MPHIAISSLPEALLSPPAYPHTVVEIRLVETHLSWVFLTGEYVYKVKKLLRYPFVDFSTIEQRRYFCEQELRLNRRFNTEIYLDVLPIINSGCGGLLIGSAEDEDKAVDWAVKMRQFPPSMQADVLLENRQLREDELHCFGRQLANRHKALPRSFDRYDPLSQMLANFAALKASNNTCSYTKELVELENYTRQTAAQFAPLFDARRVNGFVRECHGDLHLSNIVRLGSGLTAFDCLEFNKELCTIDTINDVAFLFMDCLVRERPNLAYTFVDGYLDRSGDYAGIESLNLFSIYRSMVRAKIAALRLQQAPGDALTRSKLASHIEWASKWSKRGLGNLILMHGYSGSGKSYWANRLIPHLGAIRIRSDVLRKVRAGISPQEPSKRPVGEALYSVKASEQVYLAIANQAKTLLRQGDNVLIDATFLRSEQRQLFYKLAAEVGVACQVIALQAPHEVLLQRIQHRAAKGNDPSDADSDVLDWQLKHSDPLTNGEPVIEFDTETGSIEHLLKSLKQSYPK